MAKVFATDLLKQQEFPESFRFYFKNRQKQFDRNDVNVLKALVRPRLKIAVVTETWPPEINGVAHSLLQLCKGLQKKGHKILLIRPSQKEKCQVFQPNSECLVVAQSIPKYPSLKFGWPQFLKVSHALHEFMPDVVHIVTEGPLGLTALHAAKAIKIPVSSGFHSAFQDFSRFFDLAFLLKPIQRYLCWFHNNTHMTCVPNSETEMALRQLGVHCEMVVVGRGVDTTHFSPRHRSETLRFSWRAQDDTLVLLYVGRLSPEKEINVLINAYKSLVKVSAKNVRLVIVGDGPERQALERLAGLDVIFMGSLFGLSLAQAYASADVFVFASQIETFGNVVLEAMASGLPVIAYDYACAQQYLKHQQTGWLIPLGKATLFIQQIHQLPHTKILRKMGEQACQTVQHVGWHHPVLQMEYALYQVVEGINMPS